jgi:tryptophan synthase beta subunit
VKVKFNEAALKKAVAKSVDDWAAKMTRKINALSPAYTGRPLPEVKAAVARVWAREAGGAQLPEPHLVAYAEQIAAGGRVTIRTKK